MDVSFLQTPDSLQAVSHHPMVQLYFEPTEPIFDIKGNVAAIVYAAATPFWLACSFMMWYLMDETKMFFPASLKDRYKSTGDVFQWWLNVTIWGQLLIFFAIVQIYDAAITRAMYFVSVCISASGPFLGMWMTIGWWVYEVILNGMPFYGPDGTTFVVVKILLAVIYGFGAFIFTWEMMWPILDWWQKLEQLSLFIPYERPSAADVEAGDYKVFNKDLIWRM